MGFRLIPIFLMTLNDRNTPLYHNITFQGLAV